MATYTQAILYEQDITGATNTNVLAIQFSQAVTGGRLTAWDTTAHTTIAKEILAGTTEMGAHSWLRAEATAVNVAPDAGAGTPPTTEWKGQTKTTTTFQLKGDTYYVTFAAVATGNQVRFIVTCFVPYDSGSGTTGHDPVYTCRYTYTGTAPTVTWYWNTGTETVPVWTEQTAAYACYPTGPDTTTAALDPVTAPATNTKFPEEWWWQTAA